MVVALPPRNTDPILATDICFVPSVMDKHRLEKDIQSREQPFCICQIAREYHIPARDAEHHMRRACRAGVLKIQKGGRGTEVLYVPNQSSNQKLVDERKKQISDDIAAAYRILEAAYPNYVIGKKWENQPEEVKTQLPLAFERLVDYGYLPQYMRHLLFNHTGMVMLIKSCFANTLVRVEDYMRRPDLLEVRMKQVASERIDLIQKKFGQGVSPAEEARLSQLTELLRKGAPAVSDDEIRKLQTLQTLHQEHLEAKSSYYDSQNE